MVGTPYLPEAQQRQALGHHAHQPIGQGLATREVYEVIYSGRRMVLLEAPTVPHGVPVSWKGDYRARAGESLMPLSLDELDEIR